MGLVHPNHLALDVSNLGGSWNRHQCHVRKAPYNRWPWFGVGRFDVINLMQMLVHFFLIHILFCCCCCCCCCCWKKCVHQECGRCEGIDLGCCAQRVFTFRPRCLPRGLFRRGPFFAVENGFLFSWCILKLCGAGIKPLGLSYEILAINDILSTIRRFPSQTETFRFK